MKNVNDWRLLILCLFVFSLMIGCENPADDDGDGNGGISGVDGFVYSIVSTGSSIYVGGSFLRAGGELGNANISKFSGSTWSVLDNGTDSYVRSIATNGNDVYVAGAFENIGTSGSVAALHIAKFDGSGWNALGSGIQGNWPEFVNALAHDGSNLYAGGSFSSASGVSANNIAMWDGSSWVAMGTGVNGKVNDISIGTDGSVYVGGHFTTAGGIAANNIAMWDGSGWSTIGGGVGETDRFDKPTEVHSIALSGTDVYVGGSFDWDEDLGYYLYNIAKWDGSSWNTLARMRQPVNVDTTNNTTSEKASVVTALSLSGSSLYAGGDFMFIDGFVSDSLNHLAVYESSVWKTVGGGVGNVSTDNDVFQGVVRALIVKGTDLYAGGKFKSAGDETVNYIAKWDGSAWHSLR